MVASQFYSHSESTLNIRWQKYVRPYTFVTHIFMGYSILSEWKAPISPNFQNFVGAPISTNFKMKEAPISPNFQNTVEGILTFLYILSCKNTVSNSNLLVQLKTACHNTFEWVF